jgi:signal transduction histidine kinase
VSQLAGLRLRITLLVAGVVAFCLLAGFVTVYRGTASRLRSDTDRGLREDMAAVRAAVPARFAAALAREARNYIGRQPLRPTTHMLFVIPPGGTPVTNEPELLKPAAGTDRDDTPALLREEAEDARAVLHAPAGLSSRVLPGVGPVRLLVTTAATADGIARFGIGEPTGPVERAESTVKNTFLLAAVLGMLAALGGGILVASRISAPLRRMARVAARVEAGDLSPRMELGGPRDEVRMLAHSFDQTIVRGQLEVLAMTDDPSAREIHHVERIVRTEIDRMARLVDDLLLLAQAGEDGFLRPEPIDLPDFLRGIVDGLRPTVGDRRLELGAVPSIVVDADPDRMAQALRNLLRNATVHTGPGGLARLSAQAEGDGVRLAVDDDGPGVPVEDRQRIFNRFARLDASRARDGGGAGLGLAIVKVIAEAHGGAVWVERSPEGGARFVLELSRARAARPAASQAAL